MSNSPILIDSAGRRRSPATLPGYLAGRAPRNKGMEYPPDPPRAEEIVRVMRHAGQDRHGLRARALIAVLWRAGLRISEALALNETDIDGARGSCSCGMARAISAAGLEWTGSGSLRSLPDRLSDCCLRRVRCSA
jgi:hypothetical protein